jgi:hypothetical protein
MTIDNDRVNSTPMVLCSRLIIAIASFVHLAGGQPAGSEASGQPQTGTTNGAAKAADSCTIPDSAPPDTDHQLSFGAVPAVLRAGTLIDAAISPELPGTQITALCFDTIALSAPKDSTFKVTVPPNPAGPGEQWSAGPHQVSASIGGKVIRAPVKVFPRLDAVRAEILPGDKTFLVTFAGDGFDDRKPSNNIIQMDVGSGIMADQNVCWNDADCAARNSKLRGRVTGAREIVVSGLDPSDERSHPYQVCVAGQCTGPVSDEGTKYLWLVPGISFAAALLLALIVVRLAALLKPVEIVGEKYLLTLLFLDKETNTYSLSKLQFYLWTFVAVFGYLALTISRHRFQHFTGLPPIPPGLPGIVAIAAGTAVGAQVITNSRGPKGGGEVKPSIADFVTTGGVVAAERVQFLVWTLVGAFSFFAIVWIADPRAMTDLPEVPWSLLSISGLSAFGYLGGKLAWKGGPVISEVTAKKGPDPKQDSGTQQSVRAVGTRTFTEARKTVDEARTAVDRVSSSEVVLPVIEASRKTCEAALKAITAAESGNLADAKTSADAARTNAAAAQTAADQVKGTEDSGDAHTLANAAANVAQAAQAVSAGMVTAAPSQPVTAAASALPNCGLLDIRGRTLSPDATFKMSQQADPAGDDLDLSFDLLKPEPDDRNCVKKPRIVECDSGDRNFAKRLLLVLDITDKNYAALFTEKSTHTLIVTNPDAQKAVFKFTVPESQKPG